MHHELQYQDSRIMDWVLTSLRKENIPAIPVHDSVIVPYKSANLAEEIMVAGYQRVMKTNHTPLITREFNSSFIVKEQSRR